MRLREEKEHAEGDCSKKKAELGPEPGISLSLSSKFSHTHKLAKGRS